MTDQHEGADVPASPFENIKFVRLPDGRTGTVVGVWNFGEAFEVEFEHSREIWAADELLPHGTRQFDVQSRRSHQPHSS